MGLPPPFWAFAWAGGQALARYVARQSGAGRGASACSISPAAPASSPSPRRRRARLGSRRARSTPSRSPRSRSTREANAVEIIPREGDMIGRDEGWDVVLAGRRRLTSATWRRPVTDWLRGLARRGAEVLIGDPGRSLSRARTAGADRAITRVPVTRDLEDCEIKRRGSIGSGRSGALGRKTIQNASKHRRRFFENLVARYLPARLSNKGRSAI